MPCLDMKEGRVVKEIHFIDLKDAGDPIEGEERGKFIPYGTKHDYRTG